MTAHVESHPLKPLADRLLIEVKPHSLVHDKTTADLNIPRPVISERDNLMEAKVVNISDEIARYTVEQGIFIDTVVYIPPDVGWVFYQNGNQFRIVGVTDILIPDADKSSQPKS